MDTMHSLPDRANCGHTQRGVGLIEVLVAVLILGLGLIGLVGLQMQASRSNQSASLRSTAVINTYSIVESMRADRATTLAGGFNVSHQGTSGGSTFATSELTAWQNRLAQDLGTAAGGAIVCVNTVGSPVMARCSITIQWDDTRGELLSSGGPATQSTQLNTEVVI